MTTNEHHAENATEASQRTVAQNPRTPESQTENRRVRIPSDTGQKVENGETTPSRPAVAADSAAPVAGQSRSETTSPGRDRAEANDTQSGGGEPNDTEPDGESDPDDMAPGRWVVDPTAPPVEPNEPA